MIYKVTKVTALVLTFGMVWLLIFAPMPQFSPFLWIFCGISSVYYFFYIKKEPIFSSSKGNLLTILYQPLVLMPILTVVSFYLFIRSDQLRFMYLDQHFKAMEQVSPSLDDVKKRNEEMQRIMDKKFFWK